MRRYTVRFKTFRTESQARNFRPGRSGSRSSSRRPLLAAHSDRQRPSGSKRWRFKYRFDGRERLMALGTYPSVSLREARARHDAALGRSSARDAILAPSAPRRRRPRAWPLPAIASRRSPTSGSRNTRIGSRRTARPSSRRLNAYVLPKLGQRPVGDISAAEVLEVLRVVEAKGIIESAHRTHQVISAVLRYAVSTNRATSDACAPSRGADHAKS